MKDKDSNDFFDFNNVEIEYNEDFDSSKTKSLTKFPNKKKDFFLNDTSKNFSKSLNFNSRQCFAPKIKYKKYDKKPSPLYFKKMPNKYTKKTQCEVISEDFLSEKESSLVSDSSSSDYVVDNLDDNNDNEENKVTDDKKDTEVKKSIDDIIDIYKQGKKFKSDMIFYEHKTIGHFPYQGNEDKQNKNNLKFFRNNLHKIKIKSSGIKNKDQEFTLNNKMKKKYRLDLLINNKKSNINNEYSVIPINKEENSDSDDDSGTNDMSNLRGTISYSQSKLKKESEKDIQKTVNIYEVLRNSVKK